MISIDWYSAGPSVFHQMMVYYQNQIINNEILFPMMDYQGLGYGVQPHNF